MKRTLIALVLLGTACSYDTATAPTATDQPTTASTVAAPAPAPTSTVATSDATTDRGDSSPLPGDVDVVAEPATRDITPVAPEPISSVRIEGTPNNDVTDAAVESETETIDNTDNDNTTPEPEAETASGSSTAATPAPAATQPSPAPAAPQYRVNCPSGEVITIDYQPTNAQMRELCGMTPAPTGTVPIVETHRITCSDGTQHTFDRRLSDAEIDEVCGTSTPAPTTPPPTTTPPTTLPPVRILRVTMTYQGGDWFSQGLFADDTRCPAVADISYTVEFDNGDSTTGRVSVPINSNPSVALPYDTSMTIHYDGPGGAEGCGKGLMY